MAWKCNCSCDFRLLVETRSEPVSLFYALTSVTLCYCTSVCMFFFLFSSRKNSQSSRWHRPELWLSCVWWATHVLTHFHPPACEKWHCKVHLRRWAGNDTLTVWLQWQRRLSLWFVFSTFPDRCLSSTSFDKEPTRPPFPKAISLKTLKITCHFICFRVKCRFQPYRFDWGGHHVLLNI